MSCAFYWQPVRERGVPIKRGTSSNIAKLNELFGAEPWVLDRAQTDVLRAMAVASGDGFYDELRDLVEEHGRIQVEVRF